MNFTVRDWMINTIVFVDPDATVADALKMMRRRYIQSVIVNTSPTSPEYGIITSTDISDHVIAMGKNPGKLKARDIMHSPLITINAKLPLKDCAMAMKENRVDRVPVVDDTDCLVGMISATDFLVSAEAMIES